MAELPTWGRRSAALALAVVRRGTPDIIWTPAKLGDGDHLYLWLTAWARWREGRPTKILYRPECEEWIREFPTLNRLTAHREEVGFLQRRMPMAEVCVPSGFTKQHIKPFIRNFLLTGSDVMERIQFLDEEALVICVDPDARPADSPGVCTRSRLVSFIHTALDRLPERDERERIVLVTEDPEWCRKNLGFLSEYGEVTYVPSYKDPFNRLVQIALAKDLVLSDSAFSHWGGYLASSRDPEDRPGTVLAPLFPDQRFPSGEPQQLLDEWLAIPEDMFGVPSS